MALRVRLFITETLLEICVSDSKLRHCPESVGFLYTLVLIKPLVSFLIRMSKNGRVSFLEDSMVHWMFGFCELKNLRISKPLPF